MSGEAAAPVKIMKTDKAPAAVGTYSQGVNVNGLYLFSGQIGLDPKSMSLAPTFETQLEQILNNIDALLESENLTRTNIIKTTIFLLDLQDFSKVNEAYIKYFKEPYPARSCVEVKGLPKGALVEIEVMAYKSQN